MVKRKFQFFFIAKDFCWLLSFETSSELWNGEILEYVGIKRGTIIFNQLFATSNHIFRLSNIPIFRL